MDVIDPWPWLPTTPLTPTEICNERGPGSLLGPRPADTEGFCTSLVNPEGSCVLWEELFENWERPLNGLSGLVRVGLRFFQ